MVNYRIDIPLNIALKRNWEQCASSALHVNIFCVFYTTCKLVNTSYSGNINLQTQAGVTQSHKKLQLNNKLISLLL